MDGNTSVIVPPIASPASTVKPNVMVDGCPMIAVPNTSALEVSAASAAPPVTSGEVPIVVGAMSAALESVVATVRSIKLATWFTAGRVNPVATIRLHIEFNANGEPELTVNLMLVALWPEFDNALVMVDVVPVVVTVGFEDPVRYGSTSVIESPIDTGLTDT
jgi:hypothetical protein